MAKVDLSREDILSEIKKKIDLKKDNSKVKVISIVRRSWKRKNNICP